MPTPSFDSWAEELAQRISKKQETPSTITTSSGALPSDTINEMMALIRGATTPNKKKMFAKLLMCFAWDDEDNEKDRLMWEKIYDKLTK